MLKILCAGCLDLSPAISSQFTVEMCAAAKNCEKINQNHLFGEGVCLRSFKVINVDKPKKLVMSASYDMQHVCAYLQPFSRYTRYNCGKITTFRGRKAAVFDAHLRRSLNLEGRDLNC